MVNVLQECGQCPKCNSRKVIKLPSVGGTYECFCLNRKCKHKWSYDVEIIKRKAEEKLKQGQPPEMMVVEGSKKDTVKFVPIPVEKEFLTREEKAKLKQKMKKEHAESIKKISPILPIPSESIEFRKIYGLKGNHFISIVVGAKNRTGPQTHNFFKSLASQSDKNFELIIVDYGSSKFHQEKYRDYIKKFEEFFPIRYFYIEAEGWNRPKTLNIGIGKAWASFIMTTDLDIIFRYDFIEKLKKVMASNRFVHTRPIFLKEIPEKELENIKLPDDFYEIINKYGRSLLGKAFGTIQCASKEWFVTVNGYDERMKDYPPDDQDMWHRARKAKWMKIHHFGDSMCLHQKHKYSPWRRRKMQYRPLIADKIVKEGHKIEIEKPLVTIVMPVVFRKEMAKRTANALLKHANFPFIFKMIINPDLGENLLKWCKERGIIVIPRLITPIVKMKMASVQLCDTKYLMMMDSDMEIKHSLMPILHFMEENPNVGVCATCLVGKRHGILRHGANFRLDHQILKIIPTPAKGKFHFCDYVHHGAVMMRKEVFRDVTYDLNYEQGWEHEDIFLQIKGTRKWKVASCNTVAAETLVTKQVPKWYAVLRHQGIYIGAHYFRKKWRLKKVAFGRIKK